MNFPTSPSLGLSYTFNGRTWTWNGTGWNEERTGGQVFSGFATLLNYVYDIQVLSDSAVMPGDFYQLTYV